MSDMLDWTVTITHSSLGSHELTVKAPSIMVALLCAMARTDDLLPGSVVTGVVKGETPKNGYYIPESIREGLMSYVFTGREVGSFLQNVIANNLLGASGHADEVNKHRLWDIVSVFYNCTPPPCYGSEASYASWVQQRGLLNASEDVRREWARKFKDYANLEVPEELITSKVEIPG